MFYQVNTITTDFAASDVCLSFYPSVLCLSLYSCLLGTANLLLMLPCSRKPPAATKKKSDKNRCEVSVYTRLDEVARRLRKYQVDIKNRECHAQMHITGWPQMGLYIGSVTPAMSVASLHQQFHSVGDAASSHLTLRSDLMLFDADIVGKIKMPATSDA